MRGTLSKLMLAAALAGSSLPSFANVSGPAPTPSRSSSASAASASEPHRAVVLGGYWWGGPGWWDDPYWHAPYAYFGPPVVEAPPGNLAPLGLDIRPSRALVTVDGIAVGEARDYNATYRRLWTKPGPHTIVLQCLGYRTLTLDVDTSRVANYTLRYKLEQGYGLDARSSPQEKLTASLPRAGDLR